VIDRVIDKKCPEDVYAIERPDYERWLTLEPALSPLPQADLEWLMFRGCVDHLAAQLPFYHLFGEGDIGTHNIVADADQLLRFLPRRDGQAPSRTGFDTYVIDLEYDNDEFATGHALGYIVRSFHSVNTFYFENFIPKQPDTFHAPVGQFGRQLFMDAARELFSPYLNRDIAQGVASRIASWDEDFLHDETQRIARLAGEGQSAEKRAQYECGAESMEQLIFERRKIIPEQIERFFDGVPVRPPAAADFNPFRVLPEILQRRARQNPWGLKDLLP
jgi:hypothetical protein